MLPTVAEVTALARTILQDLSSEWADDNVLLPHVQRAYRYAARYLRSQGVGLLKKQSSAITIAIGTTSINRTAGTVYPPDMLRPLELREGLSSSGPWTVMQASEGFLPGDTSQQRLGVWDWRNDSIVIPNHGIGNVFVQLLYEAELPAINDMGATLLIPDCLDPVALMAAAYAAQAHDETTISTNFVAQADKALAFIAVEEKEAKAARGARWSGQ